MGALHALYVFVLLQLFLSQIFHNVCNKRVSKLYRSETNSHPFLLPQQDKPKHYRLTHSSQSYLCVAGRDSRDKTLSTMCLSSYGSPATLYLGVDADIHYIWVRLGILCVQLERLGTRRAQFSYSKLSQEPGPQNTFYDHLIKSQELKKKWTEYRWESETRKSKWKSACVTETSVYADVSDRVPGTDGTSRPGICRIVCGIVCAYMWHNMTQKLGTLGDRQTR